jgi:hypothetical protein
MKRDSIEPNCVSLYSSYVGIESTAKQHVPTHYEERGSPSPRVLPAHGAAAVVGDAGERRLLLLLLLGWDWESEEEGIGSGVHVLLGQSALPTQLMEQGG